MSLCFNTYTVSSVFRSSMGIISTLIVDYQCLMSIIFPQNHTVE